MSTNTRTHWVVVFLAFVTLSLFSCQSDPEDEAFVIHPDFRLERVASEPLVMDPVDLEFDGNGEAYVLEMPGYPMGEEQSRLIHLIDHNGDGVFDERRLFAEQLRQASSLLPWKDGWLVAAPPYLIYLADTNADGKADKRDTLMAGFSDGNLQHNFNGLTYGLDNWIYAGNGGNGGNPYWIDAPANKFNLYGGDFRFKPDAKLFERTGRSSGGHEITFDDWGRIYLTHNVRHIATNEFLDHYRADVKLVPEHARHNISDHEEDGLARVYPIGEQETRVNHPEQSGYFSGACGITHYGGGAFPAAFESNVFVADVVLNLIHRDVITPSGSTVTAARGRSGIDFLAASDRHFRPVNMTVGPDGSLFVIDMHREVIEHPEWIPDELEQNMDLNAGKDKGRIYRIVPKEGDLHNVEPPSGRDQNGLIALLGHDNQWFRITAQRLLVEDEPDGDLDEALVEQVNFLRDQSPYFELHLLWTLQGRDLLDADMLDVFKSSEHPGVREQLLKAAEQYLEEPAVQQIIWQLLEDTDIRVKRQAAFTLSLLPQATRVSWSDTQIGALSRLLRAAPNDHWVHQAVMLALRDQPLPLLEQAHRSLPEGQGDLMQMIAIRLGGNKQVLPLLEFLLNKHPDHETAEALLTGMVEGVKQAHNVKTIVNPPLVNTLDKLEKSLPSEQLRSHLWAFREVLSLKPSPTFRSSLTTALQMVVDTSLDADRRLDYLHLLPYADFADTRDVLLSLIKPDQPRAIQLEAIGQLGRIQDVQLANDLIAIWPQLGPSVRRSASDILLYNELYQPVLLDAFEQNTLRLAEFNFDLERRRELLTSNNPDIRTRAKALFSDAGVVQRKEAMANMRSALDLTGDHLQGKQVFTMQCAQCHRYGSEGVQVGPDLTEIARKSKETLMHDILDPNAAADPAYINHVIRTGDGVITGIIADESDDEITLLTIGGLQKRIQRREIVSIEATGSSLMPEGLEAAISPQQMADLLSFLREGP